MLAGCSTLLVSIFGILVDPLFLIGNFLIAINLIMTSVTNRCVLHDFLVRLGVKEREDIFFPGGALRSEVEDAVKTP
jgi:hypothetical protein